MAADPGMSFMWELAGLDSLKASHALFEREHLRSSINRSYFAAYSFAHAVLTRIADLPAEGNWSHKSLPLVLRNALNDLGRFDNHWRAVSLHRRKDLEECRALREFADYQPAAQIEADSARLALRCANRMLVLLEDFK